jgi:hypothetical protein
MLQNIYQDSLLFTNRYELIVNAPKKMGAFVSRTMTLRCNSVSVPGRSLSTTNYRFYGPQRQMPYEPLYTGELGVSYILSGDMRERVFFENWLDIICNKNNYKFSYYDEYITTLTLNVLDKTDSVVYSAEIEEAYPKQIGEIGMGYDKENEYMIQDVTFAFRKYTPRSVTINSPAQSQIQNGSGAVNTQQNPTQTDPRSIPFGLLPNSRDGMPRQWFEMRNGKMTRIGRDGSQNGIL